MDVLTASRLEGLILKMKIISFQYLIPFQQKTFFDFKSGHSAMNNSGGVLFIILQSLQPCRIEPTEKTKCIPICV